MENWAPSHLNGAGVVTTVEGSKPHDQSISSSTDYQASNSRAATSHLLKTINAHTIWDGITDHDALVRIDIVVESEPDTHLVLLDLTHHQLNSAVVTDVQRLPTPLCSPVSKKARQPSNRRFGDTPIPLSARSISERSTLLTPHGENYDIDTEDNFSSSKRRLFPILRSVSSNSPVLRRKCVHLSPSFETSSSILSTESVRSLSYRTVEVHPESKTACPITDHEQSFLPLQKHSGSPKATNVSSRRHCEACKRSDVTPYRRRSEGPQKHLKPLNLQAGNKTARNPLKEQCDRPARVDSWSKKNPIKESRHVSGLGAFSNNAVEACTVDLPMTNLLNSATKQAALQGLQAYEIPETNSKTFHNRWSPLGSLPSRLPARALNRGTRYRFPYSIEPSYHDAIENQSNGKSRNPTLNDSGLVESYTSPSVKTTPSPNTSPRVWLRRDISSGQYFPGRESTPLKPRIYPLMRTTAEKLEVHFEQGTVAGIYRVEIEASVCVSRPDPDGWRDFSIPGFLSPQETSISGLMSFQLVSSPREVYEQSLIMSDEPNLTASCPMQAQFDTSHLFDVEIQESAKMFGKFNLQSPLTLRLRLKEPVHEIAEWGGSIVLCTSVAWSGEQGIQVKHHASLTIENANQDIFAERIRYSLLIKNGSFKTQDRDLETGQFSISVEDTGHQEEQRKDHTELSITRDAQDLSRPLQIYFTANYPGKSVITIPLPSVLPKIGEMLSERILLAEPPPPLVIEYQTMGLFTTWKCLEVFKGQGRTTQFDRVKIPRLLPQGLKDDVILEIKELNHVQFQAMEALGDSLVSGELSDLVWNLKIKVDRVYSKDLECRMSFNVEVGHNRRLLTMYAPNWIPDLSIVDGRITSKFEGEWREDENGNLTMFNFSGMAVRQRIKVKMRWKELVNHEVGKPKIEYGLPNILGKSVLGGSLKCMIDGAVCVLHKGEANDDTFCFSNNSAQTKTRLPTLHPHYTLTLSVPNVRFHSNLARTVRFTDEDYERSSETSNESQSCMGSSEISSEVQLRLTNDSAETAETQASHSEQASHDEGDALAGRGEDGRENRPGSPSEPNFQPVMVCISPNRGGLRSFLHYPSKLLTGLLQRMRRPFLLTCVLQLALATVFQIWNPVDVTRLFRPSPSQHFDCQSKSNIGATANGEIAQTHHDLSTTTMERMGGNETGDGMRADDYSQHVGELGHEQPMEEVAKVMDWIDRALGWKSIDTS